MTHYPTQAPELLGRLTAQDFDDGDVNLTFEDGSHVFFASAFMRREGKYWAIYTEHCGYHLFLAASVEIRRGPVWPKSKRPASADAKEP
jgi:hypothetical protein